ncbi:uncharacterized protein G2W53_039475 [Senna tora]|uniref:Uncharacterized protein n=1 Tax=Senna tora TaxID=362788 RepID=A0A834T1D8_9FABA|nr:uncharacterized protein G2W53_039475 [Senna tora]
MCTGKKLVVARIEAQRGITASNANVTESSALVVKTSEQQKYNSSGKSSNVPIKKDVKKSERYCNHGISVLLILSINENPLYKFQGFQEKT